MLNLGEKKESSTTCIFKLYEANTHCITYVPKTVICILYVVTTVYNKL